MSDNSRAARIGLIEWHDLTVENAEPLKDFYKQVVGWTSTDFDMNGYNDYCMNSPGQESPVAGVCHQRGSNKDIPPVWLVYINVDNLEASLQKVKELGGKALTEVKSSAHGSYCVIEDPAGVVSALFEPPQEP